MNCQEEGGCDKEAVGTDVAGTHLCREHLNFSEFVQRLLNAELKKMGVENLIPDFAKLDKNN